MKRLSLPCTTLVLAASGLALIACPSGEGDEGPGFNTLGTSDGTGSEDTSDDATSETTEDTGTEECVGGYEDPGAITFSRIATWRDDADAAYSMIHDDMCGPALQGIHTLAVPALNDRGLTAALGPFVEACESGSLWGVVQDAQDDGHEIINHSYNHPTVTTDNTDVEVVGSKSEFDAHLSEPVTFFIFPFDFWTDATLAAVGGAGHIGARAGSRDDNDGFDNPPLNPATPDNDLEIEFDVWPRTYSKYASYFPEDLLAVHVWNAIEDGAWAVREFHSVTESTDIDNLPTDEGFGPVPLSHYEDHLDFLVQARDHNLVWTANPSDVIRYRHARTACGASVAGNTISYDTSSAECTEFATPISVVVTTANDVPSLEAKQGGAVVRSRKIAANTFAVTADPTQGDVTLEGCASPGLGVGEGAAPPPKASPADSVCDIQTVTGVGMPGLMDDLERPNEELQILPNPAQGDGRDGSWSWYPQNVDVAIVDDGPSQALRYAGQNLDAWSGLTLAFLGGNGAGTCYDASAYTGLRFRIRGSVNTPDELDGKVIVSLVTAETQTQVFGGDLDGMGGHFNFQVDVGAEWATVEIPFASFNTPTWGDTLSLTQLALAKLQAIDWGVANTATTFELYVDDIEIY